jgi:hypothetical protein
MDLHHKYRGVTVVKVKIFSGFYPCPLSSLVLHLSMKYRDSMGAAFRTGELSCTVTLYWHEYGGHTVVSGGN